MTWGPGWMPIKTIAPIIRAMAALEGRPKVSMGMNCVCAAALFAASGPATPRM